MAYIRRLIPCAPYEIKTFEAWLEELRKKKGYFWFPAAAPLPSLRKAHQSPCAIE